MTSLHLAVYFLFVIGFRGTLETSVRLKILFYHLENEMDA